MDSARSDNPRDKAQRATQNLRTFERQEVADQILARLESPEMLMIERHGITMTIASSLGNASRNRGELIVRNGETLVAILNNNLTTKLSQRGDLFTMTVRDPSQLQGAVIQGAVGNVDKGGRSEMALTFETIRLPNGQTYRFAGVLESVRTLNGDAVKVDNEGSAQGANRTPETIQRAGIALELPSGTELTIRSSGPR